jgi:hypothetical protein
MKNILLLVAFVIAHVTVLAAPKKLDALSFLEIQARLLNKEVIILGDSTGHGSAGDKRLMAWYYVSGDQKSGYDGSDADRADFSLRGRKGSVISVTEQSSHPRRQQSGENDIFGKLVVSSLEKSRAIDPEVQVVVKLEGDDERLIAAKGPYRVLAGNYLQFPARIQSMKNEIEAHIARLVGKNIYNIADSRLLGPDATLDELGDQNRKATLTHNHSLRNLTPLKVIEGKVFEPQNVVVIKVELPNTETKMLYGELANYDRVMLYKQTFFERIDISALEKIPSAFSANEVASIKNGAIFRGMSEDALIASWGFPDTTNDWGSSGGQWIYYGNRYVYLQNKTVRDWQIIQ